MGSVQQGIRFSSDACRVLWFISDIGSGVRVSHGSDSGRRWFTPRFRFSSGLDIWVSFGPWSKTVALVNKRFRSEMLSAGFGSGRGSWFVVRVDSVKLKSIVSQLGQTQLTRSTQLAFPREFLVKINGTLISLFL
ncbi:hypothetical protein HanRHA438_Chr09g0384301 [Helianthus annuus]|nr:hypothetical protein HanIR_Chr09g0401781 [Helianthus annuus]KAJ0886870.1 hypothetical protein HanRHA438_Chr09g0384301 [Helianthus annuus]